MQTNPNPPRGGGRPEPRRVTVVPGGPLLVEGPVEVLLEDGSVATSDRFLVALCACRRSRSHPFCDTSHRRRSRRAAKESATSPAPGAGARVRAGLDLRVDRPIMVLGAPGRIPASLTLNGGAAAGCDTHVAVRVRARELVGIRLFSGTGEGPDPGFATVFEGELLLPDGRLVIGDVTGGSRLITCLGEQGTWAVRVAVDEPAGFARAVHIAVRYARG